MSPAAAQTSSPSSKGAGGMTYTQRRPPEWDDWPAEGKADWYTLSLSRAELFEAVLQVVGLDRDEPPAVDDRLRTGELVVVLVELGEADIAAVADQKERAEHVAEIAEAVGISLGREATVDTRFQVQELARLLVELEQRTGTMAPLPRGGS